MFYSEFEGGLNMGVEYVEKTKKLLENMALELLKVPKLKDIKKL